MATPEKRSSDAATDARLPRRASRARRGRSGRHPRPGRSRYCVAARFVAGADIGDRAAQAGQFRSRRACSTRPTSNSAEDLSSVPEVRKSILNFGFPDLTRRTIDENRSELASREKSRRRCATSSRGSRPSRSRRGATTRVAADTLSVRFLVSAELRAQPVNVQAEFVAEVEVELGQGQDRSALGMNREFLKFYNQELAILREQAAEFARGISWGRRASRRTARRQHRSDDRRVARRRGVSGRAGFSSSSSTSFPTSPQT